MSFLEAIGTTILQGIILGTLFAGTAEGVHAVVNVIKQPPKEQDKKEEDKSPEGSSTIPELPMITKFAEDLFPEKKINPEGDKIYSNSTDQR